MGLWPRTEGVCVSAVRRGAKDGTLRTAMYSFASLSFCSFLATITTFAPFCASNFPRPLPIPCEPPVIITVCGASAKLSLSKMVKAYPSFHLKVVLPTEEAHDVQCQHGYEDAEADGRPEEAHRHGRCGFSS